MVAEVLEGLNLRAGGAYVDGTVGGGGHSRRILEGIGPHGRLLGIDWDPDGVERARKALASFGERVTLVVGNYAEIREILAMHGVQGVDGILLDLGASYEQLTSGPRGFSFRASGPLDMRFNPGGGVTAAEIVNHRCEAELRNLLRTLGEEPLAGRIARAIVRSRPIATTAALAELVQRVSRGRRGRIHPATRVFQALRIAVNHELANLERGIRSGVGCLNAGGRLCVLTYHSLEDRLVKQRFRETAGKGPESAYRVLTPKPIRPRDHEVKANPRSRSAKLRVLERIAGGPPWRP
jgi:16S rRNA (cytosine1402-N4)-methyltransferase